jgi:hypothetical protein
MRRNSVIEAARILVSILFPIFCPFIHGDKDVVNQLTASDWIEAPRAVFEIRLA